MLEVFVMRTSSGATTEQASAPAAWWELVFESRYDEPPRGLPTLSCKRVIVECPKMSGFASGLFPLSVEG
jgi:hypothetical protein